MPTQPAQSDPWQEAAKNFRSTSSEEASSPKSNGEDWKLWQPDSYDPSQHSVPQNFQRAFDQLTGDSPTFDNSKGVGYNASVPLQNLGVGLLKMLSPALHPVQALKAFVGPHGGGIPDTLLSNWPQTKSAFKWGASHPVEAAYQTIPSLMDPEAAENAVKGVGEATERGGLNLGNAALGARGPKLFKFGMNPARGAYEEGVLPAMSKHSASMKISPALERVGKKMSDMVDSGGNVPLKANARAIESPANEIRSVMQGPGGGGRSISPVEDLIHSMEARAPGASAPIYGPHAGTPFTAEEAVQHISRTPQRALPPPTEEIPLAKIPYHPGSLSKPITIEGNRPMPREFPSYGANPPTMQADLGDIPGEAGPIADNVEPWGERFNGMKFNEHMGEVPGTRGGGGHGAVQGVLRRPMVFSPSDEPTGLTDLRHPHSSARDTWKTIQNIDKNTRFNPDPEVEGLNEVRREMRGGLRGNLEEAVPGLRPVSTRYGDLKAAEEALDRTMHSGTGLAKMAKIPGFPLESGVGKMMYRVGKSHSRNRHRLRVLLRKAHRLAVSSISLAVRSNKMPLYNSPALRPQLLQKGVPAYLFGGLNMLRGNTKGTVVDTAQAGTGVLATIVIDAAGTGWAVNDTFTIAGGTGGVGKVTAETAGIPGAIALVTDGSGYTAATGATTTAVLPSVGTGLTVSTTTTNSAATATLTVQINEGSTPLDGDLLTAWGTSTQSGVFNVTRALITSVSITAATGAGTISFASTASNQSTTADGGQFLVEIGETSETLTTTTFSSPVLVQAPQGDSQFTIPLAVSCPSMPTAATFTLQRAIRDIAAEYTNTSAVVTIAGGVFTAGPCVLATLERGYFYRLAVTSVSGGTSPTVVAKVG